MLTRKIRYQIRSIRTCFPTGVGSPRGCDDHTDPAVVKWNTQGEGDEGTDDRPRNGDAQGAVAGLLVMLASVRTTVGNRTLFDPQGLARSGRPGPQ